LVCVSGALSSLRDDTGHLDAQVRRELLETACNEADRLNRFVGNLLDMTRIEAGSIRLNVEPCDIQDLVGCALAAMERWIGERRVDVTIEQDLPLLSMDMVLMTQVLVNILDNALKYAPKESGIDILAYEEKEWVAIEVNDRGPGVLEHDLKRVFDKFYRIPVPEGAGGTGLGLSICKGIVEAHGGRIFAENRSGGGLKIVLHLPLTLSQENPSDD
jgi:two-component system sensor histidine kinase KdpD